jgi:hypothetical protein
MNTRKTCFQCHDSGLKRGLAAQPLPRAFDIAVKNEQSVGISVRIREIVPLPAPWLHAQVLVQVILAVTGVAPMNCRSRNTWAAGNVTHHAQRPGGRGRFGRVGRGGGDRATPGCPVRLAGRSRVAVVASGMVATGTAGGKGAEVAGVAAVGVGTGPPKAAAGGEERFPGRLKYRTALAMSMIAPATARRTAGRVTGRNRSAGIRD